MRVDTTYRVCFSIITACLLNWNITHEISGALKAKCVLGFVWGKETLWDSTETITWKKEHEVWMLTTNLITTASCVYQHSIIVAFRYLRGSWKTLLCPSLVVACTQVTVGLPHLAKLQWRHRNTLKIKNLNRRYYCFLLWSDKDTYQPGLTKWPFATWWTRKETLPYHRLWQRAL